MNTVVEQTCYYGYALTERCGSGECIAPHAQPTTETQGQPWYEAKTGNHQGLIIEEGTGRNVAVTYDKADAATIVREHNSHARMVTARMKVLQLCSTRRWQNEPWAQRVRAALAATD